MTYAKVLALILSIAADFGLPPYFVAAIALTENPELNPSAVSRVNQNGTVDRGVMQLNSSWFKGDWDDPEENIEAACVFIWELIERRSIRTFYQAAISYNAGPAWIVEGYSPPEQSKRYATNVMRKWSELAGDNKDAGPEAFLLPYKELLSRRSE